MLRSTQCVTSRREFLVRSAATAAGTFLSIGLPALGSRTAMAQAMSSFTPSIWFTLTPDGKVTMHIVKAEMGQHVGTGLAQIIAEELEVKWDDVRLDSPLESVENFAIYGLAYTVNSGSITIGNPIVLNLRRAVNGATVSWPATIADSLLEQSGALASSAQWSWVTNTPATNFVGPGTLSVNLPVAGNQFFRVRQAW